MSAPKPNRIKKSVFLPTFSIIVLASITGLINSEFLVKLTKVIFSFSLAEFGWLYQILAMAALGVTLFIALSKAGRIRLGGPDAKPAFSLPANFAMALTGGIATGIVTYGVNEPIIYLGNIYGETARQSFAPQSGEAAIFALARCFHNWSFIPYAMYSIVGLMIAYMHFNRGFGFSISSAIAPVLGKRTISPTMRSVIDVIAVLAIALGLASDLGAGLALLSQGLNVGYGLNPTAKIFLALTAVISIIFIASAVSGLKRGIRVLSSVNVWIFYAFLSILLFLGPLGYILSLSVTSIGYWLHNFFLWSFDTKELGGEALVNWWTLYDWAVWIAYAPLMGLFLARISYGRTLREFLLINWVLPSVFGIVWFAIWGGTAIDWQMNGTLDLVAMVKENGAVSALWGFLDHLPFSAILIPLTIAMLVISFTTVADSMSLTIAAVCTENPRDGEEPPSRQKIFWGLSIGIIAYIMAAFGGGVQGLDGIKYLAAAGGIIVLFLFALIVAAAVKTFIVNAPLRHDETEGRLGS